MATNPDFRDLFSALSDAGAEFLVVGSPSRDGFTAPRYTKDLDIWVRPTPENAERVRRALAAFGAPLGDLTVEDLSARGTIFQIGIEPNRVDVVTSIDAVRFEDAWQRRVESSYGGTTIHLLSAEDLIANERAVGRAQDLLDVERLERARRGR